jgi:hypothetical protein
MTRKVLIKFALKRLSQEIVLGAGRPTAFAERERRAGGLLKRGR